MTNDALTSDSVLITPAGLAPLLGTGDAPTLLDVRWRLGGPPGIDSYRAGHLPGAVFVDLDRDLAGPPGKGGRHPLPAAGDFQAAMRRAGVSDGRPVVVYDEADSTAAARAWWLLRYFGHPDVRVLDGGFREWAQLSSGGTTPAGSDRSAFPGDTTPGPPAPGSVPDGTATVSDTRPGRPVTTDEPSAGDGDFTARPGQLPLLDAAAAAELARSGLLLDARAEERYRGETEPVDPVAGHIPGAVSVPTAGNVTASGRFRPRPELAARFEERGAASASGVGVYCGSGVTAAHEVLALTVAGIPAALYAGSWSEWITDPSRPVATGASRG